MAQSALTMLLLAAAATSALASLQDACDGQAICEEGIPASGSAMLQVSAKAHTDDHDDDAGVQKVHKKTVQCEPMHLQAVHLEESRNCIPANLQEMHLKAVRRHAALLAARNHQPGQPGFPPSLEDLTTTTTPAPTTPPPAEDVQIQPAPSSSESSAPISIQPAPSSSASSAPISIAPSASASSAPLEEAPTEPTGVSAEDATLDAAGFKEVTSLCCPQEMEAFFDRVLVSKGYEGCSKPHIQGLMHWFTCVPDMDYQYMLDVIEEGNPCKYWTKTGEACPALSETCAGEFCR